MAEFPPLVYCEDQCSTNGTYVNGVLIGNISCHRSPYLLSDGDVITIRPYWAFTFNQSVTDSQHQLDELQMRELEVLSPYFRYSSDLIFHSFSKTDISSDPRGLVVGFVSMYFWQLKRELRCNLH